MFPPVLSKADFVRRYKDGEFGNASPTWDTLEDWLASKNTRGLFHLRNRVAGGETRYNLSPAAVRNAWPALARPEDWYLSAMAPHDLNLIQGEVWRGPTGMYLMYSPVVGKPMRDALAEKTYHLEGVLARLVLKKNLCWNSYDWLMELLDRYPDHTVEFSAFSEPWGTLYPRFNTCFWEVRCGY